MDKIKRYRLIGKWLLVIGLVVYLLPFLLMFLYLLLKHPSLGLVQSVFKDIEQVLTCLSSLQITMAAYLGYTTYDPGLIDFFKLGSVLFVFLIPFWLGGLFLWRADKIEKGKTRLRWKIRLILFVIALIILTFLSDIVRALNSFYPDYRYYPR